jgi:hypothetical protein|nr:hypothetical protein [Oxalobacteraceae bacterium]
MSDIKKILILALPRSGTTIIQTDLATLTKLPNLSEPLHDFDRNQLDRWYSWLGKLELGIVKVLSTGLESIDFEHTVQTMDPDHVVLIERTDLAACCLSLYYAAEIAHQYHWAHEHTPPALRFQCPLSWVKRWVHQYQHYATCRQSVLGTHRCSIINYEKYMNDQPQDVLGHVLRRSTGRAQDLGFVAKFIAYQDLCENYSDVYNTIQGSLC